MPNVPVRCFCAAILSFSLLLTAGSAALAAHRAAKVPLPPEKVSLSAGTSADPLLSRAYLTNTTRPFLLSYLAEKFGSADSAGPYGQTVKDAGDKALAGISLEELAKLTGGLLTKPYEGGIVAPGGGGFQPVSLTSAKTLLVPTGATVFVLSGSVMGVSLDASSVIDVVQGREFAGDWLYTAGRRIVISERGGMSFETLDDNAVLLVSGGVLQNRQAPVASYTDLANALAAMGLFKGTGDGLRLERTSLRGEALTLLTRLLGKEAEALAASSPSTPFSDVPGWLLPYASFGVKNGLTNGIGQGLFGNYLAITADEYMTFLLRALGYTDQGASPDFYYRNALDFAVSKGIFSINEAKMLSSGAFLREKLVYLSYYTLFARTKDGKTTLLQRLIDSGAVSRAAAEQAVASVNRVRP